MKKRLLLLLSLIVMAGSAAWANIGSGSCQNGTWVIDDNGKLTVNINGKMKDYGEGKAPWYQYAERIKAIHISSGCKNIGRNGFYGLYNVESVTGGENVESVAMFAFELCGGGELLWSNDSHGYVHTGRPIPQIYFPKCDYVGECAFAGCDVIAISLPLVETWKSAAISGSYYDNSVARSTGVGDHVRTADGASSCLMVDLGSKTEMLRAGSLVGPEYVFCQNPTPPDWERLYDRDEGSYALSIFTQAIVGLVGGAGGWVLGEFIGEELREREYEYPFGDYGYVKVIVPKEYLQTYKDYYPNKHSEVSEGYMCAGYKDPDDHSKKGKTFSTGRLVAGAPIYENGQLIGGWYEEGSDDYKYLHVFFNDGMPSYEGRTAPWASAGNVERMYLYVPDGQIPARAFKNGNSLNTLYLYVDSDKPLVIGESAFEGNTRLQFFKPTRTDNADREIVTVGKAAFKGCTKLMSFEMGIRSLGVSAFEGCSQLGNPGASGLRLHAGCSDIPERAFYGTLIDRLNLSNVRSIGREAFMNSGLDDVNLNNVLTVGSNAFDGSGINEINFGGSTRAGIFGSQCFANCKQLRNIFVSTIITTDAVMPSNMFDKLTLSEITLHAKPDLYGYHYENHPLFGQMQVDREFTFPVEGSLIGGSATATWELSSGGTLQIFANSGYIPDYESNKKQPWYQYRDYIWDVVINNCPRIGKNNFSELPKLRNVSIPRDCKEIRDEAFRGCENLKNIYITRVETLGSNVFEGCTSLETIELGMSLASVGDYVFKDCHALNDIENLTSTPATTTKYSFAGIKSGTYDLRGGQQRANDAGQSVVNLIVPDAYVTKYMIDPNWSQFHISYADERGTWAKAGKYGDGMWILYDDGTLVISADKNDPNDDEYSVGFWSTSTDQSNYPCTLAKKIEFAGNMTEVEAFFYNFENLESVSFCPSIRSIKPYAFSGCSKLKNVNFEAIDSIGTSAFDHTAFSMLDLSNVKYLGNSAFSYCQNLVTANLGSVCNLRGSVFSHCTKLAAIDLGSANLDQASQCFSGCSSLKVIAVNATRLSSAIFADCTALKAINLGSKLESIEYDAFDNCNSLDTIYIDRATPPALPKGERLVQLGDVDYRFEDAWPFDGLTLKNIHLVVSSDYIPAYKAANIWKDMTIEGDTEYAAEPALPTGGSLGRDGTWYLDTDGTFIVDVSGDIEPTDEVGKPWSETFNAWAGFIKTVVFTDNVTSIPDNFFGGDHFSDASAGIETVKLGRFLRSVGVNSLSFSGIKDVYVYSENRLELQDNTFDLNAAVSNNATLHVLWASDNNYRSFYQSNSATSRFPNIVADIDAKDAMANACGTLGTKGYWSFADGVLTVNYNGAMPTITKAETDPDKAFRYKWIDFLGKIEEIVVMGKDVEIQPYFLYYEGDGPSGSHPDDHIKSVRLGENVKSIGRGALSLYELKNLYCYSEQPPTLPATTNSSYKAFWASRITANQTFLHVPHGAKSNYGLYNTEWANFANMIDDLNPADMPSQQILADFETGKLNQVAFLSEGDYPWDITNEDSEGGRYSMKSGNKGVANSSSAITAMYFYDTDGIIYFMAKCMGEGSGTGWDKCLFYIDGELQFSYGALGNVWSNYSFPVSAGMHTFKWEYTKDSSSDPVGDGFFVDNIYFLQNGKDDDLITGVETIDHSPLTIDHSWYDLSGRKLSGKLTQPGLYINGGRKVVIK